MTKGHLWVSILAALMLSACSSVTEPEIETTQTSTNQIAAHRGDLEARPSGWIKTEWDNSVQAISSARNKSVSLTEVDLQLNRSASALAQNPDGILYLHHESTCDVIDQNGRPTGERHNVATASLAQVDRCAERLSNVLNTYAGSTFILEMKFNARYASQIPKALYNLLRARGERTVHVVSSLEPDLLEDLKAFADADRVSMSLLRVFGWRPFQWKWVSQGNIRDAQNKGFNWVAFHYENVSEANIDYAQNLGLTVGGWHWDDPPTGSAVTCSQAAPWADRNTLGFMIIDCIGDLKARGWR